MQKRKISTNSDEKKIRKREEKKAKLLAELAANTSKIEEMKKIGH